MSDIQVAPPASRNGSSAPPEKPRPKDPHIGLRFWVQLGQVEVAGFQECTGFGMETEIYEYSEGGLNTYTHKLPVRVKHKNITLKRGLDEGQDLFQWYVRAMKGEIKRQNISIIVYDSQGNQVRKWDLQNAWPCKWNGPDLKTDHGAVAVESVEIAHEGLLPTSR
jgi:phage tail-like protein